MRTFVAAHHSAALTHVLHLESGFVFLSGLSYPFAPTDLGKLEGAPLLKTISEIRRRAVLRCSPIGIASAAAIEFLLGRIQKVPLRWLWLTTLMIVGRWLACRGSNAKQPESGEKSSEFLRPADGGLAMALKRVDAQPEDQLVLVMPTDAELEAAASATLVNRQFRDLSCCVLVDNTENQSSISKRTWLLALDLAFNKPVQVVDLREFRNVVV